MPKVTIYIRNDDMALWSTLNDKPTWIHEMLQYSQRKDMESGMNMSGSMPAADVLTDLDRAIDEAVFKRQPKTDTTDDITYEPIDE